MALGAVAYEPTQLWETLGALEVLGIVEPLGERQAQHALGTQRAYRTSFQYTKSQDTPAILR